MSDQQIEILLVEDNPGDAALIQNALWETGGAFSVTVVKSLSQAQSWVKEVLFDVILLDLGLPDSQGLETLERLLSRTLDIPVVVLTGLDDAALGDQVIQKGAHDYLVKSYTYGSALKCTIHYAIDRHHLRRELNRRLLALEASETRLRRILEANADGMLIVDEAHVVRFVNPAAEAILGCSTGDLLGQPFTFPLTDDAEGDALVELNLNGQDGRNMVIEVRVVKTLWDGDVVFLASLRDITARREAEQMQVLIETAGAAAHEINQPLAILVGLSDILQEDLAKSNPDMAEKIGLIKDASQKISEIVKKMQTINHYATKPYAGETRIVDFDAGCRLADGEQKGVRVANGSKNLK